MKFALIFLILIPLVYTQDVKSRYVQWMKKHKKSYVSKKHADGAFKNFVKNDAVIEANNADLARGEPTFKMGHNDFSDWSDAEFQKILMNPEQLNKVPSTRGGATQIRVPSNWNSPGIDLRTAKVPVRNQQTCGSCWAFAATGVFEYKLWNTTGVYHDLSEQQAVDCARENGCQGGWPSEVFTMYEQSGVSFEASYPYKNQAGTCQSSQNSKQGKGLDKKYAHRFEEIPADERLMAYIISQYGWITACLNAKALEFYEEGIIRKSKCSTQINHAIVIAGFGYDPQERVNYWICRNSWGTNWGEDGYFRLERGTNACDIAYQSNIHRAFLY